jgi:L-threonylcarbamoyladenylate synthase
MFWPGPLTLVLPRSIRVPDLVTSGGDTVAVRVPAHPVAQALLSRLDFPLAAPSANRFGRISPTNAMAVHAELGDSVSLILNGGACSVGVESSVLDLTGERPRLLRAGGVSLEDLEWALGKIELGRDPTSDAPIASPGLLKSHYAPRKALRIVQDLAEIPWQANSGWLAFGGGVPREGAFPGVKDNISSSGDVTEAATHFFQGLRFLDDHPQVATIYAKLFPEKGLGRALNDRLRRAEGR